MKKDFDEETQNKMKRDFNEKSKTFKFKMAIVDILNFAIKSSNFIIDKKSLVRDGYKQMINCSRPFKNKIK